MLRAVLIVFMLLQPLQWAWAGVHMTADAVHSAGHGQVQKQADAVEVLDACKVAVDASDQGSCHDNSTHLTTVLGLNADRDFYPRLLAGPQLIGIDTLKFISDCRTDIERPRWVATR